MGQYALYIWSAYGIAFVMMTGLVIATILRLSRTKKRLAILEEATGRPRRAERVEGDET
jgi:heme exporter protein D